MKEDKTKQLVAELADVEKRLDEFINRAYKAEDEVKRVHQELLRERNAALVTEREKTRLLFEIVRWLANPENSRDPWNEMQRQKNNIPLG